MLDNRNLTFSHEKKAQAYYDATHRIFTFWGQDNGKKIRCAISEEALEDYYHKDERTLDEVFSKNHLAIEQEARRKYVANRLEKEDGSILITIRDLIPLP